MPLDQVCISRTDQGSGTAVMSGDNHPIDDPMAPPMSTSNASFCALVSTSEAKARHILDALAESFDSTHVVVAASEDRDGKWTVSLHFREAPDETAVRALIALAAGPEAGNALVFDNIR